MTRAITALVVLALAWPAAAQAQAPQTNAPPGNSAIDEYLETVPGASGSKRPQPPAQNGGDGALTPAERARLERLGPDGKTLANAVDATSPSSKKRSTDKQEPKSDGRSPAREILGAFSGSDGGSGMGVLLPAILVAALLTMGVIALRRRRGTP